MKPHATPGIVTRRQALRALAGGFALPVMDDPSVDLALVLAIDCSFSVDSEEYALQMRGLGEAFRNADIKAAILSGRRHSIAVSAFHWSNYESQSMVVPWTVLASAADAEALGIVLSAAPRKMQPGGTAVGSALLYGAQLFDAAPPAVRRIIDISSDGRSNGGVSPGVARDRIVARGIVINALAITNEDQLLDLYYEKRVAGGDGHFVIKANDYQAYGEAIARKLFQEIVGAGTA